MKLNLRIKLRSSLRKQIKDQNQIILDLQKSNDNLYEEIRLVHADRLLDLYKDYKGRYQTKISLATFAKVSQFYADTIKSPTLYYPIQSEALKDDKVEYSWLPENLALYPEIWYKLCVEEGIYPPKTFLGGLPSRES